MTESIVAVPHKDGTSTLLGFGRKKKLFDTHKRYPMMEEGQVKQKLEGLPLPFEDNDRSIIGWGGFSVAFRVTSGNKRFVAVMQGEESVQSCLEGIISERKSNSWIAGFSTPQDYVISQGLNGKPAVIKISPEVEGATLKSLSPLFLIRDDHLLRQYTKLSLNKLAHFFRTGRLIDDIGHHRPNLLWFADYLGFLPFSTNNTMVDFETHKLVQVDYGTVALKEGTFKVRPHIIMRAALLATSIALACSLIPINALRNRLFYQPTSEREIKEKDPENERFVEGIADTIEVFKQRGLDIRVLGSVAMAGSIQTRGGDYYLTPRRTNGTIRDIDVLILNASSDEIQYLNSYFAWRRTKDKSYPEVSLFYPLSLEKIKDKDFRLGIIDSVLTQTALDQNGNLYLVYKNMKMQIPAQQMDAATVSYNGIQFPTLKEGILAGFAITRRCATRTKDIYKIIKLLELGHQHIPAEFIDFAREVRLAYPREFRNYHLIDILGHFTGGYLGTGQLSYLKHLIKFRGNQTVKQKNGVPDTFAQV